MAFADFDLYRQTSYRKRKIDLSYVDRLEKYSLLNKVYKSNYFMKKIYFLKDFVTYGTTTHGGSSKAHIIVWQIVPTERMPLKITVKKYQIKG